MRRHIGSEAGATGGNDRNNARHHCRVGDDSLGYATRPIGDDRCAELGRFHIPGGVAGVLQLVLLEGGEEEELVLDHGTAERSSPGALCVVIADRRRPRCRPAVLVVLVEAGIVIQKERGTVKVVGPALGDDLDLRAGIAAEAGVVGG